MSDLSFVFACTACAHSFIVLKLDPVLRSFQVRHDVVGPPGVGCVHASVSGVIATEWYEAQTTFISAVLLLNSIINVTQPKTSRRL